MRFSRINTMLTNKMTTRVDYKIPLVTAVNNPGVRPSFAELKVSDDFCELNCREHFHTFT